MTTTTMKRGASGEAVRRGRQGLVLLLGMTACDGRCGGSSVGAESSPPAPETAVAGEVEPEAAPPPMKEVHVTLADVEDIPYGELKIVEAPKYEVRKLGKPKVLMEGKHLRLPDTPWPLASDRGFVLVQDGPDYTSKVLEAQLLDLRTGDVVATLRDVYRSTYAVLGVALGQAEVDGVLHEVLVHASDGQIVALWAVEQRESRFVVINAGTGDAWVFEVQQRKEGAEEEDPYPPYRYAFWGDLRKRPPEPKEAFAHELEKDSRPPGGWLGPTWSDPAKAPLFLDVDSDDDECAKVELKPDGYKCVPFGTWAMTDGWRGTVEAKRPPIMRNVEKGEAQVLELGERCGIEEVTLDPPRALLRCKDYDGSYLWSPEKVVRLPLEVVLGSNQWNRGRSVLQVTRHAGRQNVPVGKTWVDLIGLRAVHHAEVSNFTPYSMEQQVVFYDDAELQVLDMRSGAAHVISARGPDCSDHSSLAADLPMFAYECLDKGEHVRWTEVVNFETSHASRLAKLREAWLVNEDQAVVGITLAPGSSQVVRWKLN